MSLGRLKYFAKIVDIGSLTQAAEALHVMQPTLSQQVATLEGELNQQLLIRAKRGITPTDVGKILYTYARATLCQCEQIQLAMHNTGQALSRQVSIDFAPGTAASSITMPLLQVVRVEFPEIVIYLHENSDAVPSKKLISRQLDMAVIYERSPATGTSNQALLEEDLFLIGTQNYPGQSVDVNVIAQINLSLPGDCSAVRFRVDEAFSPRRLTAKVTDEIESTTTPTAAIVNGIGVTVLPESAVRSLCGAVSGWTSRITAPPMSLSSSLNLPTRANLSSQAQAAKELLMPVISFPVMEKRQWQLVS